MEYMAAKFRAEKFIKWMRETDPDDAAGRSNANTSLQAHLISEFQEAMDSNVAELIGDAARMVCDNCKEHGEPVFQKNDYVHLIQKEGWVLQESCKAWMVRKFQRREE